MRSFIACSSAACVFGGARLISSASRSSVKIGPLVSVKALVWKLNRFVPSTSPGIRSGVNWMRPNLIDRLAAKHCASNVLAVPGTPSSRIWPLTSRLVSIRSMTSSCPTTALPISLRIVSVKPRISRNSIRHLPLPSKNVARERRQRRAAAPARHQLVGAPQDLPAIGLDVARAADAPQPVHQPRLAEPGRRMQLAPHVLHDLVDVALQDDRAVTRMREQVRGRLDQAALARLQRRRQRDGRAEPAHG